MAEGAGSGGLLEQVRELRTALAPTNPWSGDEAGLFELIRELESLKSAAAAAQAGLAAEVAERREARDGHTRGLGAEVALARRESPHRGARLLGLATGLVREMPHAFAALQAGELNEWRATLLVRETAVLSAQDRAKVDEELAGRWSTWGDRKLAGKARAIGYRLDPGSALRRTRGAQADRRVTLRPAPDTMTFLTGFLPVAQGVACWAALGQAADAALAEGDVRTRSQIMADTLVARVTGTDAAVPGTIRLHLTMTAEALLAGSHEPATLEHLGPIPAAVARGLVRDADRVWVQRLFTRPDSDELVAMESSHRLFTGDLRRFLILRDETCRTPWCDAPIRHLDHIRRYADGGPTSADNGQGLCVTCNLIKEARGWKTARAPGRGHRVRVTSPTGLSAVSSTDVHARPRVEVGFPQYRIRLRPTG